MTVNEIISRTLAQKKMAAMVMEDTVDEVEAVRARHAAEQEAAQAQANGAAGEADGMMDVSDGEDEEVKERKRREEEERQREIERARAIQATSMNATGPMKIRTDYVPKCEFILYTDFGTVAESLVTCSGCKGPKGRNDHLFRLWPTSPCRRTARTHAN